MNVTLKPFDFAQAVARAGLGTDGVPLAKGPAAAPEVGFQKALSQALDAVSKSQNDATAMQREVSLDNPTVSLEQTMVAMQKAQIGFAATLQVRNKLVQAYSEIMQMQVIANRRQRGIDRVHIGCRIEDPSIDYAAMAKSLGVYGEGPIENPRDLGPALKRASAVVKKGEPALVDVVSQGR